MTQKKETTPKNQTNPNDCHRHVVPDSDLESSFAKQSQIFSEPPVSGACSGPDSGWQEMRNKAKFPCFQLKIKDCLENKPIYALDSDLLALY
jgi:hypothetical protein